uniref:C2H2-type domain-containing protein n=1 Tax=Stomoxys calcitrans TaxID=35570 RepID=A0A1I8PT28_STOCA
MDFQIKEESFDAEEDYNAYHSETIIKKEEPMVEEDLEYESFPEYQVEGYSIHFLDERNDSNANDQFYDYGDDYEDEYMYDDDALFDAESFCPSEQSKEVVNHNNSRKSGHFFRKRRKASAIHRQLEHLLSHSRVRIICPVCQLRCKSLSQWARHLSANHFDYTEELKSYFNYSSLHKATCKQCNQVLSFYSNHFVHYLSLHCPEKRKLFICNVCKLHKDSNVDSIIKHLEENHKKPSEAESTCPIMLCAVQFPEVLHLQHHFKQAHIKQYKTKFEFFSCHLCNHPKFDAESHFYDHLMNLHGLCDYNWKRLKFRQIIDDSDEHFECSICSAVCVATLSSGYSHELMEHYLTHEKSSFWYCRYCHGKFSYSDLTHMCKEMHKYFAALDPSASEFPSAAPSQPSASTSSNLSHKIVNGQTEDWEAFEGYIMHVCPYCGNHFKTFDDWQLHLRMRHYIHTLRGLGMAVDADPEHFRCKQCKELVGKTSRELHTHRFKHLPHMPYECLKCYQKLPNVQRAFEHFLTQCGVVEATDSKDVESMCFSRLLRDDENNWIELFCGLCKHIQFSNMEHIECHFKIFHNNFEENFIKSSNNIDMMCGSCNTTIRSVSSDTCLSHYISHIEGPFKCLYCQRMYKEMEICKRHVRRFHKIGPRMKRSQFALFRPKKTIIQPKAEAAKTVVKLESPTLDNGAANTSQEALNTGLGTLSCKANVMNEFESFISYACAECNQRFDRNPTAWNEHIKSQHTFFNDNEVSEVVNGRFKCKHCDLMLDRSISQRQKHKLTHMPYKSFICAICDTGTTTLGLLYGHLRRIHFRKGSFECPICLVVLTTAYERANHVNKTHPRSEWPKKMCLICYRNYGSLSSHMLTHDTNRPKHTCPECGVDIINLYDLKKHMEKKHNTSEDKFRAMFMKAEEDDNGESNNVDPLFIPEAEEPPSPNRRKSIRHKGDNNIDN